MSDPLSKPCTHCKQTKVLDEFSPRVGGVLGRMSWCKECRRADNKQRAESINATRRKAYQQSPECKKANSEASKKYREKNKLRISQQQRESRQRIRREVIDRYGGECECCHETRIEFLCIDHRFGGGSKERREIGPHMVIHKLHRSAEILPEYRVLCFSCNCALAFYGYCPHGLERTQTKLAA